MNLELDSLPEAGDSDGLLEQLRDDVRSNPDNLIDQIEAICQAADKLCQNDHHAAAEELYRNALNACQRTPIRIGAPIGFKIYRRLAELLESQDRPAEACLNYLTGLTLASNANAVGIDRVETAEAHKRLGILLGSRNELIDAAKHYRRGIALLMHEGTRDTGAELRPAALHSELEENLGDLQILLGDHASALGCFSRALQYRHRLLDAAPEVDTVEICQLFEKLGSVFKKLGDTDASNACLKRFQEIQS